MVGSRNRASGSKSTNNYRTNKNGYLVDNTGDHIENFIMYNKIHKNRAIGIPAINKSTGIVHMFDAIGLYKWFFEQNNKELLGYISHLTNEQKKRILKLSDTYIRLGQERIALQRKKLLKGRNIYNDVTYFRIKILNLLLPNILLLLCALYFMAACVSYFNDPVWHLIIASGAYSIPTLLSREGRRRWRTYALDGIRRLEKRLEETIDGIPTDLTFTNIAFINRLQRHVDDLGLRQLPQNTKAQLVAIANKLKSLDLIANHRFHRM